MNRVHDLDADPILVPHRGRLGWLFPSGRVVPEIRGGDGPDDDDQDKKITLTQAELDRMISDRLKRDRQKSPEPPADYAKLQADAAELATLKAANAAANAAKLTEAEATKARFDALEAEIKKSNEQGEVARAEARAEKLHSAVVKAAAAGKAVDPDDVFALLPKDAVTIGDDGLVTGAEEAVKALLEAKPHLVGEQQLKPDAAQGQRTGQPTPSVSAGRDMFAASRGKTTTATAT